MIKIEWVKVEEWVKAIESAGSDGYQYFFAPEADDDEAHRQLLINLGLIECSGISYCTIHLTPWGKVVAKGLN